MGPIEIDKDIVVVDLDGTLCDTRHRDHLIKESWDAFHAQLHLDQKFDDVALFIDAASMQGKRIVLLTGRMEKYRVPTMKWLREQELANSIDELWMRGNNDFRKAYEIKVEALTKIQNRVLVVLDDNDNVVEHVRNMGIRVWQVQNGGY